MNESNRFLSVWRHKQIVVIWRHRVYKQNLQKLYFHSFLQKTIQIIGQLHKKNHGNNFEESHF